MTDRIEGRPVAGSMITFLRLNGGGSWTTPVDGGYRFVSLQTGDYRVTISGPSHVEHTTRTVSVTADLDDLDFTVLEWGAVRFGIVYDREFDLYFDDIARTVESKQEIWKWDLRANPPRELWVDGAGLSQPALSELMELLSEIDNESIPDMFGGRIGPLPVSLVSWSGLPPDGIILLQFWDEGTSIADGYQVDGVRRWGRVRFRRSLLDGRSRDTKTWTIVHELFHVAFANHLSPQTEARFPFSAMSATAVHPLTNPDRLASWIVYHDGTAPGNRAPDINPTYAKPGFDEAQSSSSRQSGDPRRFFSASQPSSRRLISFSNPRVVGW